MNNDPYLLMLDLHAALTQNKPAERSELARRYAIAITDCERLIGFFKSYIVEYSPPDDNRPKELNL